MEIRFAKIDDDRLAEKAPTHWREKAARMRFERGRRQELALGGLLVEMTGIVDPTIALSENGKPSFRDHPEIHFSLSHSGDYVMCVVADRPVGCDIEKDETLDEDVKREVGSIAEWTMKEAAFKCGQGAKAHLVSAPEGYFAAIAALRDLRVRSVLNAREGSAVILPSTSGLSGNDQREVEKVPRVS